MKSLDNAKPVILVIIGAYLPGTQAGGPVRSTANMTFWLGKDFTFKILTVNHDFGSQTQYANVERETWYKLENSSVRYLFPDEVTLHKLRTILTNTDYDVVYLDSVFATLTIKYLVLRYLHLVPHSPTILAPRGNLKTSATNIKPLKKLLFLKFANLTGLYSRLQWHPSNEAERAEILTAFPNTSLDQIEIGSNLPTPLSNTEHNPPLKIPDFLHIVMICRISQVKNIIYALKILAEIKLGNVKLDIFGTIEDEHYWAKCEQAIRTLPSNISVSYKGQIPFDAVYKALSDYHLFFLPTLGENFGHSILEALCVGCPVLISNTTPWKNLETYGAGWDYPLGEDQQFIEVIKKLLSLNNEQFQLVSQATRNFAMAYLKNSTEIQRTKQFFEKSAGKSNSGTLQTDDHDDF